MSENILGVPPPKPPDVVPAIEPDVTGATTIRERLAKHRADVTCAECHRKIDPLGFSLESFDPIGRWRASIYLGKVTGAEFKVVGEDAVKAGTRAIYVGQTKFAAAQGVEFNKLDREEWIIRSVGADALVISGGRPRGVLYGVLEFLEWQVGVHWFDPMTECIPSRPTLAVPPLNIRAKPAFAARNINPYLGYSKDNPKAGLAPQSRAFWFAINKNCGLNGYEYITGETRKQFGGGEPFGSPSSVHNRFVYMPPDKYFEAHPEYYSLISGKRVRTTQICFSHPEVRAIFKKRLREFIEQDRVKFKAASEAPPRFYVIMQQDAHPKIFCECEGCMKIFEPEGGNSGLLVDFFNDLARDIRKDYSDVTLVVFPYTSSIEPPRSLRLEENVAAYIGEYTGDSWRPLTHPHNENQTPIDKKLLFARFPQPARAVSSRGALKDGAGGGAGGNGRAAKAGGE